MLMEDLSRLMSTKVANFIGFKQCKGRIKEGYDADLVVWSPEESFEVKKEDIHYRHKISPYVGERLSGVVYQSYIDGKKVFEKGNFVSSPIGKRLMRQ